jgi:alanine-glyoxylate transaminase/(R)-3-amino-2-methylpropionate-pyruvate transaminase
MQAELLPARLQATHQCVPAIGNQTKSAIYVVWCGRVCLCRFGGNPVCSAGGRAVLRVIEQEGIQQNAAAVS